VSYVRGWRLTLATQLAKAHMKLTHSILAGLLLSASLSAQIVFPPQPIPLPPPTPARHVPGAPTILVAPGAVLVVGTGQLFTQYTSCGTGPIDNAVAFALRMAQPGDVIGVTGAHPTVEFVANQNPCRQNEVSWANGAVVRDVDVVGLDATARINGIFVRGDYTAAGQGGIDRITLQGLTLRNPTGSFSPLQSTNDGRQGLLRVYDCRFDAESPATWGGKGMKFGARLYLISLDARANVFVTGAQEHNFYIDSPGYDGAYATSLIVANNQTLVPTGRTGLQVVNRIYPIDNCNNTPTSYVGAPGKGTILIRRNFFHADASAGGGSTVTVAGHHGPVWIENNQIQASGGAGGSVDTGGIVVWNPCNTWLNPTGYATNRVYVQGNTIFGTGSRPCVSISATRFAWVGNNTLQCAGIGVEFDKPGDVPNLFEYLPSASMLGWQQGGCKARDTLGGVLQCLTDSQINLLY